MVTRTARVAETKPKRADSSRKTSWTPPSTMDAPPPREGFVQRWVSTSILGQEVPHHTIKRFREGWEPRPADTVPPEFPVPTIEHGKYEGCIGVEGSILCEMPKEVCESRTKYFHDKTNDAMEFVDSQLDNAESSGNTRIRRQRKTEVSVGRQIEVMDD